MKGKTINGTMKLENDNLLAKMPGANRPYVYVTIGRNTLKRLLDLEEDPGAYWKNFISNLIKRNHLFAW